MRRIELVTLKVVRWREDAVGFSGLDGHTRAELKRRLSSAIVSPSPRELRNLWRRILQKEQGLVINNVRENEVSELWHIIETMGAVVARERP